MEQWKSKLPASRRTKLGTNNIQLPDNLFLDAWLLVMSEGEEIHAERQKNSVFCRNVCQALPKEKEMGLNHFWIFLHLLLITLGSV